MKIPPLSFSKHDLRGVEGAWDMYCGFRRQQKKTAVKWVSARTGYGLFAAEFIPEGTAIIEYTGCRMDMSFIKLCEDRFNAHKDDE